MIVDFRPNLQMMACVQVAIPILNNPEMRYLIDCYSLGYQLNENIGVCTTIEKKAMDKISNLVLPLNLQNMVKDCIMNMFWQIVECKSIYSWAFTKGYNHVNQHFKFVWKYDGTIDQKNTMKSLMENQDLNIKEKFVLASRFCLTDESLRLWKEMIKTQNCFTPLELECNPLVRLWIEVFEEESTATEISAQILESSVLRTNASMLRYVTHKLPLERQRPYLLSTALKDDVNTDVMVFCLSQLLKTDQEIVFKNSPSKVLQCVLIWPYQHMFSKAADHIWSYLSKGDFCDLLWIILRKIMHQQWFNFALKELLKEFWFESPVHFKEHAKHQTIFELLKVVLKSDMHSFPRHELHQAYIQSLEGFLSRICTL